ncbi:hypothetical protein FD755_001659, partial [Muntiacus reevesi]
TPVGLPGESPGQKNLILVEYSCMFLSILNMQTILSPHPSPLATISVFSKFQTQRLKSCLGSLLFQFPITAIPKGVIWLVVKNIWLVDNPSLGVKKPTKALLFVILSPVGPYFSSGSFNPVSLWANPKYVRAWKGGTGDCKMGGNYGSSLFAQCEAVENACQQVLWLYGEDNQITEVGTMNLFLYWINEDGEEELATPPLDGIILPGVTRQSILDLAHKWGEFKVSERYLTMDDLTTAVEENRVREMFGSGTACVVCPVSTILYKGEDLQEVTFSLWFPKVLPNCGRRNSKLLRKTHLNDEEKDYSIIYGYLY